MDENLASPGKRELAINRNRLNLLKDEIQAAREQLKDHNGDRPTIVEGFALLLQEQKSLELLLGDEKERD